MQRRMRAKSRVMACADTADHAVDTVGEAEQPPYHEGHRQPREREREEIGQGGGAGRAGRAQGNADRNGPRPDREGDADWEEGDVADILGSGRAAFLVELLLLLLLAALRRVEKVPGANGDDEAARDLQGAQGDAEEIQHIGAEPEREEQEPERVEADAPREVPPFRPRAIGRHLAEDDGIDHRVDDGEERREGEQEGFGQRR
jgi:hypothetical protein